MSTTYQSPDQQTDTASHWLIRFVAALIDSIPFVILAYIISWAIFWNAGFGSPIWQFVYGWGGWLVWLFVWPLFYGIPLFIYSYVMENSASSATFGKKIMHLKVESEKGGKAKSGQVMKRNLSKILWIVFLIDILIGVATHGPDPRQRYFDRMADTTVVHTEQAFGAPPPPPPPPPPA